MNQLTLTLADDRRNFEPGEMVIVTAGWRLDPDARERYLELRLIWYTRGKGDSDVETVQALRVEADEATGTKRLGIQLPDSPYSFSGKLVSLCWAIEFVLEPTHEACREEFTMGPGGNEVLLLQPAASPVGAS